MTKQKRECVVAVATSFVGRELQRGYNCADFIREVYSQVMLPVDFSQHPAFSYEEIWTENAVGYPLFLRRRLTLSPKRITHIGIVLPNHQVVHCSRWMGEVRSYEIVVSSFERVFEVYEFVPFIDGVLLVS